MMLKLRLFVLILVLSPMLGCHWFCASQTITQQGNIIQEAQFRHLKIGMNKNEVAIALGNTLLNPTFNNDRWDYAMTWQKGEGRLMMKRLSLFFKNQVLMKIKTEPFT